MRLGVEGVAVAGIWVNTGVSVDRVSANGVKVQVVMNVEPPFKDVSDCLVSAAGIPVFVSVGENDKTGIKPCRNICV